MNSKINVNKISPLGFYKLYLNQNAFNIGDYNLSNGKYIQLLIENNNIAGIEVNISNAWNDELNVELGNMIVFPEKITANSPIEVINKSYKTGIINPSMRDWNENILNSKTHQTINSHEFTYTGDKYAISINCINGKVKSIFYYLI